MAQAKFISDQGDQLWIGHTDSVRVTLDVGGDGVLTLTPTGGAVALAAVVDLTSLKVGGTEVLTSARVLQNVTAAAGIITSGTFADARISEGSVTQHAAALAIGWGQITGPPDFLDEAAADLLYSPLGHVHGASDITTGTLAVARGGTGLGALGRALEILRVNAGGTALEFAAAATDAFFEVGDASGTSKFEAAGADMLRFAAGSDLSVAFDAATNKVTFSYVGGGSGGISSAYTELAVGATTATASGADTATFAAAGNGLSAALNAGTKIVTYTLNEAALSIAASQLTGTLADARVVESNVTQHQAALSLAYAQLSDSSAVLDAVQGLAALGTALHVLRVDAAGTGLEFAEADAGVDLTAAYAWTGPHSHTQALTLGSYLQGTTGNGYLDLRGDSGATSGVRLMDTGNIGIGTTDIETWSSDAIALEGPRSAIVFHRTLGRVYTLGNAYIDSGGYKYKTTDAATLLYQADGVFSFHTAPSGTADTTISWTTALSLDSAAAVFGGAIASAATLSIQAYRGNATYARTINFGDLALNPAVDNQLALGYTGLRWTAVYATNGAIQTSTAESKDRLERIDPTLALRDALVVPLWRYHYKGDQGFGPGGERHRHAGPVIEDVPKLYRTTDDGINPLNVATWALAAVRGEHAWNTDEHAAVRARITDLERQVAALST